MHFSMILPALRGVLLEVLAEPFRHARLHVALHFGVAQAGLRLPLELRLRQADADHRHQPLAHVVARKVGVVVLEDLLLSRVVVEDAGEGAAEAGEMAAAVDGVDAVGEAEGRLREGVVVLEGRLYRRAVLLVLDVDRPRLEDRPLPVQVAHEALDAAVKAERQLLVVPLVPEADPDALDQIGALPEALGEGGEIIVQLAEDLGVGHEGDRRAGDGGRHLARHLPRRQVARLPLLVDLRYGDAPLVLLDVHLAVTSHLCPHRLREGVHHRGADAVEAAGNLVHLPAELAAGVEVGHDRLQRRLAGLLVGVGGDAAAVVPYRYAAVLVNDRLDVVAEAGHSLVDGVVGDLVDQVVEAALVGAADVHAGPPAYRLQPAQHLDVAGRVLRALGRRAGASLAAV